MYRHKVFPGVLSEENWNITFSVVMLRGIRWLISSWIGFKVFKAFLEGFIFGEKEDYSRILASSSGSRASKKFPWALGGSG